MATFFDYDLFFNNSRKASKHLLNTLVFRQNMNTKQACSTSRPQTHRNASLTHVSQPNMNTKQASRHQSLPKTPAQAFLTHKDQIFPLTSQNTVLYFGDTAISPNSLSSHKKAPPLTCASLFRRRDRSTTTQPSQDIFS